MLQLLQKFIEHKLKIGCLTTCFNGTKIPQSSVGDPEGFLPVLLQQALTTGYAFSAHLQENIKFEDSDISPVRLRVSIDPFPNSWILLPLVDHALDLAVNNNEGIVDLSTIYPALKLQDQLGGAGMCAYDEQYNQIVCNKLEP